MKKRFLICLVVFLFGNSLFAQNEILMPPPSPLAVLKQLVGFTTITVEYSRPSLKGRSFESIVPDGKVWRTGANLSTKITFSDDISIEGNTVPKGTYSLWSIPSKNEWVIILNKKTTWGTEYKTIQASDFLRFSVKPEKTDANTETFEFQATNLTDSTLNIGFAWENVSVQFSVKDDVLGKLKRLIVKRIDSLATIPSFATFKDSAYAATQYYRSATYNYTYTNELTQALAWLDKAIPLLALNQYQYYHLKAQVYEKMKNKTEALKNAEIALQLSKESDRAKGQGFIEMSEKLLIKLKQQSQ
jgi:Protein of unknown function (DUF2911)